MTWYKTSEVPPPKDRPFLAYTNCNQYPVVIVWHESYWGYGDLSGNININKLEKWTEIPPED